MREREGKNERDIYREIEHFYLLIYLHMVVCFHIFERVLFLYIIYLIIYSTYTFLVVLLLQKGIH